MYHCLWWYGIVETVGEIVIQHSSFIAVVRDPALSDWSCGILVSFFVTTLAVFQNVLGLDGSKLLMKFHLACLCLFASIFLFILYTFQS